MVDVNDVDTDDDHDAPLSSLKNCTFLFSRYNK